MLSVRSVPLFDPAAHPPSWNERMQPGEFAVLFSQSDGEVDANTCAILPSLPDAEAYARDLVSRHPRLRCRIYDHHGLVGAPVREDCGADFVARDEISSRFRRWTGGLLFAGGIGLICVDWAYGFALDWPSITGSRMIVPGGILLVTEAGLMLHARHKARSDAE
jgi:hypothetical protein